MDAAAYLVSQGWRGDGHALQSGRGITKPIRISQKANVLGVGKKQHDAHADQWWARAFEDTLKGLNTSRNGATKKTERISIDSGTQALQNVGIGGAKETGQGGLYSNFVRGESLRGTLSPKEKDNREAQLHLKDQRKQKRGSDNADLPTAVPNDFKRSKKRRRQQGETAEMLKSVGFDAVHQDFKNVGIEQEHEKPRERPKYTETKKQRRQRNGEGEVVESRELSKQPRATASNHTLTSDRPEKRSTEQLYTDKDADPVLARPCNISSDGIQNYQRENQRRAADS